MVLFAFNAFVLLPGFAATEFSLSVPPSGSPINTSVETVTDSNGDCTWLPLFLAACTFIFGFCGARPSFIISAQYFRLSIRLSACCATNEPTQIESIVVNIILYITHGFFSYEQD